jgi:hypothetical protein
MSPDKPITLKQFKKAMAAQRQDLHKLAAVMQKGFQQINRRLNRLSAEEKRRFSVIELAGKKYRFYK